MLEITVKSTLGSYSARANDEINDRLERSWEDIGHV